MVNNVTTYLEITFIECLAQYLPHRIQVYNKHIEKTQLLTGVVFSAGGDGVQVETETGVRNFYYADRVKPLLRPITDVSKHITHNGKTFVPLHEFGVDEDSFLAHLILKAPAERKYTMVQKLLEYHFDVFGLIEKGLAVKY